MIQVLYTFLSLDITETINSHGSDKTKFNYIVSIISSYDELCKLGKAFIENRVIRHINYSSPFGYEEDCISHLIEQKSLSKLHDYGILTTSGQCNLKLADIEQRGYLTFYCEKKHLETLRSKLFNDSRIYTVEYGDPLNDDNPTHNSPYSLINVTMYKPHKNITTDYHPMDMIEEYYPNICTILKDKILLTIINKEYGARKNCSTILLEHIS